jgi:hypothetical protein
MLVAPSMRKKITKKQYLLKEGRKLVKRFLKENPEELQQIISELRKEKIKKIKS